MEAAKEPPHQIARQMFREMDANNDGLLDLEEMQCKLSDLGMQEVTQQLPPPAAPTAYLLGVRPPSSASSSASTWITMARSMRRNGSGVSAPWRLRLGMKRPPRTLPSRHLVPQRKRAR